MTLAYEIIVSLLIVSGGFFAFVGSLGLARLPDPMMRLHGPTKATSLGIGSLLIASMLYFLLFEGQFSFHELLITIFLFLTAPVTAHMLAKTILHRRLQCRAPLLPPPPTAEGWATLAAQPAQDAQPVRVEQPIRGEKPR